MIVCDHCLKPEDEHVEEERFCPDVRDDIKESYRRIYGDKIKRPKVGHLANWTYQNASGFHEDGHRLAAAVDYGIRIRVICPGEPLCKAKFGCVDCEGRGYRYDDEDEEVECSVCDGSGLSATDKSCWLQHYAGELGNEFAEAGTNRVPVDLPTEIAWTNVGHWEEPEVEWKPVVRSGVLEDLMAVDKAARMDGE